VQRRREAACRERGEALEQRQGETGGLAGARLRRSEQIASRKDDGDGLRLNGGGFRVAMLRDGAKQLGQQPEAFEGRTYDDLLINRPAKDFAFETGSGR
jgi:hypothetical protein